VAARWEDESRPHLLDGPYTWGPHPGAGCGPDAFLSQAVPGQLQEEI